jgi:uncharacterized protein YaiI (UPF0178 family)
MVMKIWIDADACPRAIKEILFRASERTGVPVTLVANRFTQAPTSPHVTLLQVPQGPDVADDEIAARCSAGDLVVTADIPLAARIVEKGALALDPRGRLYDASNVKQVLAMRDFMDSMRGSGAETGGPSAFGAREREAFANELDRILARAKKGG